MAGKRCCHRLHGVEMLHEILVRRQQRRRQAAVCRTVSGAMHRARQHPRDHRRSGPPNQQLRSRAHEPGHSEGPTFRVRSRQLGHEEARVQIVLTDHDGVAREHHLVQPASPHPRDRFIDRCPPAQLAERARLLAHPTRSLDAGGRGQHLGQGRLRCRTGAGVFAHDRQPRLIVPTADYYLRHDHD